MTTVIRYGAGLVEAARFVGMHPESLKRKWYYGELPEGACQKAGRKLQFDLEKLKGLKDEQSDG